MSVDNYSLEMSIWNSLILSWTHVSMFEVFHNHKLKSKENINFFNKHKQNNQMINSNIVLVYGIY